MALVAVCQRVSLADTLSQSLLDSIGQNMREETTRPALMCIAYMCKTQEMGALPAKCFRRVANLPGMETSFLFLALDAIPRVFLA